MNKTKLKIFAVDARNDLIQKMKNKLQLMGIQKDSREEGKKLGNEIEIRGILYPNKSYEQLKAKYETLGYEELVEEAAYTWFNRLLALCYLEKNSYSKEVLVSPSILDHYYEASFFQEMNEEAKEELHQLRDENTPNALDKMYSIILEEECEKYAKIMPFLFEKKGSYADILFPTGLLLEDSLLEKLMTVMEESRNEEGQIPVELLGWLYQFYNEEKKDEVYSDSNKKNIKITKENIPAATQLFTPDWIVKYMVENSLGHLALESLGVEESLKENWKYYVEREMEKGSYRVEDVKIIDPAMGSGHMLTYAFDVLFDIYQDLGWSKKEAVLSILENNVYGLEIDKRAAQLAAFAIFMKGREKYVRLFTALEREPVESHLLCIEESSQISSRMQAEIEKDYPALQALCEEFQDAKEYGSILQLKELDEEKLEEEYKKLEEFVTTQGQMTLLSANAYLAGNMEEDLPILKQLIKQYKVMSQKYDVVITNPPYLANGKFNSKLNKYVKKEWKKSKNNLFATFIEKCSKMTKQNGYTSMITMQAWMFLSGYEELRHEILDTVEIQTLIQLGTRAFEEIAGEIVRTATWISKKKKPTILGRYIRLIHSPSSKEKAKDFFDIQNHYQADQNKFKKIPGSIIAFWPSEELIETFAEKKLNEFGDTRRGLQTGDATRFIKKWYEVEKKKVYFKNTNLNEKKWVLFNSGGSFRKWYGNIVDVVNWENNGSEIKRTGKAIIPSEDKYFSEIINWNKISSGKIAVRFQPKGIIPGDASPFLYSSGENREILLTAMSMLNSKVSSSLIEILSPNSNFEVGNIAKMPFVSIGKEKKEKLMNMVNINIMISQKDWDMLETSWNFEKSPLLGHTSLDTAYEAYKADVNARFDFLKANEEELNRIFIEIYGLEEELKPEVAEKDITVARIFDSEVPAEMKGNKYAMTKEDVVKHFLSYAVGCMMGRYSLDKEGLIMANSDDVLVVDENMEVRSPSGEVRHRIVSPRFVPEEHGILMLTEEDRFENDIIRELKKFLEVFGNVEDNMEFLASALGKKANESAAEVLRRYFIKDFYKDHCKMYQKRPIYWMLSSGKQNGFTALVYLHRYDETTIARIRTEYLLEYQGYVDIQKKYYENIALNEKSLAKDVKHAEKECKRLENVIVELRDYANKVKHVTEQKISLDLDIGVKENYAKLEAILKKI